MSTTTTVTRDDAGRYVMTVTMDTEADALALTAGLGMVSVDDIRKGALHMSPARRDKIESVLQRDGWATPTYGIYDQLLTALD